MKAVHKIRSHEALTSCDIRKRLKKRHSDPHRLIYDEYGELPIAFFQKYKNSICCIFASIPYFLYSVFIRHFALCNSIFLENIIIFDNYYLTLQRWSNKSNCYSLNTPMMLSKI